MPTLNGNSVLAIGDSITWGFGASDVVANGAWRYYIADLLAEFIGGSIRWCGSMSANGVPKSGQRMLGTAGRRVDTVLSTDNGGEVSKWESPDLAIIHLGTNDMTQMVSGAWAGGSISASIASYSTLLDYLRAGNPDVIVVACKIVPNRDATDDEQIVLWNSALETMIEARSDIANIFIADCYTAFTDNASWSTAYMNDDTHPNGAGEQVIANTIMSALEAGITETPRAFAKRKAMKAKSYSLNYNASASTTSLGNFALDTSEPWAVQMEVDLDKDLATTNGILTLKTDQNSRIGFLYAKGNARAIDFGSSANFDRFFPIVGIGWPTPNSLLQFGFHKILVMFLGGDRTLDTNYRMNIDGINIPLTNGSGLSSYSDVSVIGGLGTGSLGKFNMNLLRIWNGGSAFTPLQARLLQREDVLPSGPTLVREFLHTEGSGSTLTDNTGNENATIGNATWVSAVPAKTRAVASVRSVASTRNLATV